MFSHALPFLGFFHSPLPVVFPNRSFVWTKKPLTLQTWTRIFCLSQTFISHTHGRGGVSQSRLPLLLPKCPEKPDSYLRVIAMEMGLSRTWLAQAATSFHRLRISLSAHLFKKKKWRKKRKQNKLKRGETKKSNEDMETHEERSEKKWAQGKKKTTKKGTYDDTQIERRSVRHLMQKRTAQSKGPEIPLTTLI